ncbi:MAG TPA: carboxypeptidase regulatory-like domain-containing protein [Thermoanaerobaculia bacterium]
MRRVLTALLVLLTLVPTFGSAEEGKSRKKKSSKPAVTSKAKKAKPAKTAARVEPALQEKEEGPARRAPRIEVERKDSDRDKDDEFGNNDRVVDKPKPIPFGKPLELQMTHASSRRFDVRKMRRTPVKRRERIERELEFDPATVGERSTTPDILRPSVPTRNAPAPAPLANFIGLDWNTWGSGHPPDTVGDVGPNHYIQSVNSAVAIYQKDGNQLAAFTLNDFMSQGNFGNLCDTDNFGDPVILYDTFEDRWVISDFAFQLDGGGNVINPPGNFQCTAVSMTGDPVNGGWHFYSLNTTGGLGDYPKLGVWPDGIYMSVNMFGYPFGAPFQEARVFAFNKHQMYAGHPNAQVVTFSVTSGDATILPANARLQTGTPPAGTPNYFVSTSSFLNALSVYKFHVDWERISLSTFTGPDVPLATTSWPNAAVAGVPQLGSGNTLDAVQIRAMMQNQYTNIGGAESLWNTHTVRRQNTTGFAAPRWYQVDVTGGTVNPAIPQAATWDPDGANVMHRFVPSLAVDRAGNMALGYSTSNATTKPAIQYAGRLATDPVNTMSQTEQMMLQGTGAQIGTGRWGDYAAMSLDPDGCTFWFTSQYYAVDGHDWQTRVGSFGPFPGCTPVGAGGTLQGTVTATAGGTPIAGATVSLGSRTATTNASGVYTFSSLPAGTYPEISVSAPGYISESATSIIVTDGGTTTQDFALDAMATSACLVDTTQTDFQAGVTTNADLTTTPGDVLLAHPLIVDQQNQTLGSQGANNTTTWLGQTFTAAITGPLVRVDLNLFSLNCGAVTMPDLTVSIRAAAGNLPTGPDLAVATIPGFCDGAGGWFTANFATPMTLTAGTQYAVVWRPASPVPAGAPAPGYFGTVSVGGVSFPVAQQNPYAGGRRTSSSNAGVTWAGASGNANNDHGFITYIDLGYAAAGNLVSGIKDINPATGLTPIWTTLSWTATTPSNTAIRFQAAGSNSIEGPFDFVGPDGTAGTFFTTSGASLSQFYGFRYLQYKAYLTTTDGLVTPALHDVTICYEASDCSTTTATITPGTAYVCPNSVGNTASGPAGATAYSWSITNGSIQGSTTSQSVSYTAGAAGNVQLTLDMTAANFCQVSGSVNVPISLPTTPTITPGGPTTFCAGGSVLLTSSSATGNQWYLDGNPIGGETNQTYSATAAGAYTVTFSENGCESAQSTATNVTVNPTPATPTITPGGPTTFCTGGSVLLTSSSATGNQWYLDGNPIGGETNQTYSATAAGAYTVVVTTSGCASAPSAATNVTVNPIPATPTITPGGPTTFCAGGSVLLTSSSATGNQWYLDGNPIGGETNQTYSATASGAYTVVVTTSGCASAPSSATSVTVNPAPATPTITPGGPTTFCTGGSVLLTSSSATGNQWFLNGNPIGGETNQTYSATATGNYTVVVTASGCASAPSAATSVTVNPIPATPTITPGGPTTFCAGGSVLLTSSSASGNQWFLDGNPIGGATNATYSATATGNYTVVVTASGCASAPSAATSVTVNPIPATPTITPGGPTTFCTGGSVLLTSSSATGNQWFLNGNPIGGATNQTYSATATGNYTVAVTASGCTSAPSSATSVTVNPTPATPTITPGGPTTFCAGGSVLLTSSSATGNQWRLNGNPIGGATNQTHTATVAGDYTVVVTASGCPSAPSATTTVTVNPNPSATITAPGSVVAASTGNLASVPDAGAGATYEWTIGNGSITAGTGTANITFTAGAAGTLTLDVTVTTLAGCSASDSESVTVGNAPVTVSSVTPNTGSSLGGTNVTIAGSGFNAGATVTFGGTAATNVVVVNATQITARTPAHAAGAVNVVVTNTNTTTGTLTNGFTYFQQNFDPNGDSMIDPSDIFYLVAYLFTGGPAPAGAAGMPSGDANGDGVVDPADIFYAVNYLFGGGPAPHLRGGRVATEANVQPLNGALTLGNAVRRDGRWFVPVIVTMNAGSATPQALSLHVRFNGATTDAAVRRTTAAQPVFEISRQTGNTVSYLVAFSEQAPLVLGSSRSAVVAELEVAAPGAVGLTLDPSLTMLVGSNGAQKATVANRTLRVNGTAIGQPDAAPRDGVRNNQ